MEAERMIDGETCDAYIQAICRSIGGHGIGLWFSQADPMRLCGLERGSRSGWTTV
jgi:hypothetical protein